MKEGEIVIVDGKKYRVGKTVKYEPNIHNKTNSIDVRKGVLIEDEHERFILQMAAFLHDIGKPVSAKRGEKKHPEDGFCRVKDHPITGVQPAEDFCKALLMSNEDTEVIKDLVLHHMDMHHLHEMKSKYAILKLTNDPNWDRLVKLCRCDELGCHKTKEDDEEHLVYESIKLPLIKGCIGKKMPERILTGYFITAKGFKPGPTYKKALEVAHKIQIDQGETDPERLFNQVKSIVKGK